MHGKRLSAASGVVSSLVTIVFISGCGSHDARSASVPDVTSVKVVNADVLQADTQWSYVAAPTTPVPPVTADQAVVAARSEVHGDLLQEGRVPTASLVYVTNSSGVTDVGRPVKNLLAWVVQLEKVPIPQPAPTGGAGVTTISTIQWVIDAQTGDYVEARDF